MNCKYLNIAFDEAENAFKKNEIPVGAVIVKDDIIISKTHNLKEINKCCTSHAEILAINEASKKNNNWRLTDCDIYITLDPCPMCASAIKQSRIKNVYSANKNVNSIRITIPACNCRNRYPILSAIIHFWGHVACQFLGNIPQLVASAVIYGNGVTVVLIPTFAFHLEFFSGAKTRNESLAAVKSHTNNLAMETTVRLISVAILIRGIACGISVHGMGYNNGLR